MFHLKATKWILLGISVTISVALFGGYINARNIPAPLESQILAVTPTLDNPYNPAQYGVPDTLGGYKVVAVVTLRDLACMPLQTKRVLLQVQQKTAKEYLQQAKPLTEILIYLRQLPGESDTDWQLAIGGTNVSIEAMKADYA